MASGQWLILTKDRPKEPEVSTSTTKSAGKSKDKPEQTVVDTTDDYTERYEVWEEKAEKMGRNKYESTWEHPFTSPPFHCL